MILKLPRDFPLRRGLMRHAANRGWEAVARGDIPASVLTVAPDYELNLFGEHFRALGFQPRYQGHAGMAEFVESWRASWSSIHYEVEELFDLGERIALRFKHTSHGFSSGVEVSNIAGSVYFLASGTVVRQDFYFDWSECASALDL